MSPRILNLSVIVAALGYFVDIFDLFLFSVVRQQSLTDLGFAGSENMAAGIRLLNYQMAGILLGGFFWGVVADRKGRSKVLFASIFLYSIANFFNGLSASLETYQISRLVAGFGLAGELGVAITLVSEILPKEKRGFGTTFVASLGLAGSVAAALCAKVVPWRYCYFLGGSLGLLLLLLRIRVDEPRLYQAVAKSGIRTGSLLQIFSNGARLKKYLSLILVGMPIWFVTGIIMTFAPELANEVGFRGKVTVPDTFFCYYTGVVLGDVACGLLSQFIRSRKKALALSIIILSTTVSVLLQSRGYSAAVFYGLSFFIGIGTGYWAVLIAFSAEQFGTNIRATVTTSVPNLVRGSVIPVMFCFQVLRGKMSMANSGLILNSVLALLALFSVSMLSETFAIDLDFVEGM